MARLFLLFSHQLRPEQQQDVRDRWNITEFVSLPEPLQSQFSAVPPEAASVTGHARQFQTWLLSQQITSEDRLLVQGEYGLTYYLVSWGKARGWTLIYATTSRQVSQQLTDEKLNITRTFTYTRFREYE